MSVNKAILLGSLGKNPEIRTTQNGSEIGSFSIATSEKWKDKDTGERKEKTEWHNITVFGSLVKVLAYIEKGSKVYVEGKITTEKYTDKQGVEKYATKIVASAIDIIKGKIREDDSQNDYAVDKFSGREKFDAKKFVADAMVAQEESDDMMIPF